MGLPLKPVSNLCLSIHILYIIILLVDYTLELQVLCNVSVLGTYFECEGVKINVTTSALLGDHGNDRSSNKLQFAAKHGQHDT